MGFSNDKRRAEALGVEFSVPLGIADALQE